MIIYDGIEEIPHRCSVPHPDVAGGYIYLSHGSVKVGPKAIYQCNECGRCWRLKLRYSGVSGSPYDGKWVSVNWYNFRRRLTIARYGKDKS
jgi:hypothetical protein